MLDNTVKKRVLVIVGATAVGKTDLAIELAQRVNGEIISADSRLFYQGMDIGTAKPTCEQMSKVPHHLIDCAEPEEVWSLSVYHEKAYECIEDILVRGKVPMLVGGTGQYIRAITEGWELPQQEPNLVMRQSLENWAKEIGPEELHRKLRLIDPYAAQEIDWTNVRRTIRALEVIFMTGRRFSEQRRKSEPLYDFYIIGLTRPRKELYERIDLRVEEMFRQGLVAETQALLVKGISLVHPNLSAIGYREVAQYLNGNVSLSEAMQQMKKKTREFVRRQRNWFKPDDITIHWFEMSEATVEEIIVKLRVDKVIENA
jgi:tRNA dimethylallyltransferase